MKLQPYKPKQGRYARLSVAGGIGVLLLFAAWRVTQQVETTAYFQLMGLSVPYSAFWGLGFFVVFFSTAALFVGGYMTGVAAIDKVSASFVNLLIDTESELRKVAWPGPEELRRYTIVVIACILVIGGLIYAADVVISFTMRGLDVLPI